MEEGRYRPFPRSGVRDKLRDADIAAGQWIVRASGRPVVHDSSDVKNIQKNLYCDPCIQLEYHEQEKGNFSALITILHVEQKNSQHVSS